MRKKELPIQKRFRSSPGVILLSLPMLTLMPAYAEHTTQHLRA